MTEHSFAVCAYKESPYLEECILSLLNQTIPSHIYIATSTDNTYIQEFAKKYNLPLYVNTDLNSPYSDICRDWNFAVSKCQTQYITIAHQDDIYAKCYAEKIMNAFKKDDKSLIAFSDYGELRHQQKVDDTKNLRIKRILLKPISSHGTSSLIRKRIALAFGNSVSCPAVSYNLENLQQPIFTSALKASLDWETWEKLSKEKGSFIFIREILMYHRIHAQSETSRVIKQSHGRNDEDLYMFEKFWPKPVAKLLAYLYRSSEDSNNV